MKYLLLVFLYVGLVLKSDAQSLESKEENKANFEIGLGLSAYRSNAYITPSLGDCYNIKFNGLVPILSLNYYKSWFSARVEMEWIVPSINLGFKTEKIPIKQGVAYFEFEYLPSSLILIKENNLENGLGFGVRLKLENWSYKIGYMHMMAEHLGCLPQNSGEAVDIYNIQFSRRIWKP